MHLNLPTLFALTFGVALLAQGQDPAWDQLELHDGRVLSGSVRAVAGGYELERKFGSTWIAADEVLRLRSTHDPLDELRRMEDAGFEQGSAAERYELARYHELQGSEREAKRLYLAVLRVDSDHAGARQALGYVRHRGEWLTFDERQAALGFVRYAGEWMTPEQRDARLAQQARRRAEEARLAAIRAERRAEEERREAIARAEREDEERREREVARLERAAAARAALNAPAPVAVVAPCAPVVTPQQRLVLGFARRPPAPRRDRARAASYSSWTSRRSRNARRSDARRSDARRNGSRRNDACRNDARRNDARRNDARRNDSRRTNVPQPSSQPQPARAPQPQPRLAAPRYAPLPPGVR